MSPGSESVIVSAPFTKIYVSDYEKLRDADLLGLKESR